MSVETRPYSEPHTRLRAAGLRPTRQRLALAKLLFEAGERHITAEQLHAEAMQAGMRVSLATVYNTLHQFTRAELLREVVVETGRSYFDTNTSDHHHFYVEDDGRLFDIPGESVHLERLPSAPEGMRIDRVDVVVRLVKQDDDSAGSQARSGAKSGTGRSDDSQGASTQSRQAANSTITTPS